MKTTLNLPDDLADRLSRHEGQVERILELGLRLVDSEGEALDADVGDELPTGWRAPVADLIRQRRRDSGAIPPSDEELFAYHRGDLPPDEEEKLLDRLTLHPEAVRDLVDLVAFDRDQTPSTSEQRETTQALHAFRARLEGPGPRSRRNLWLAAAAVLALAVGASWIPSLLDRQVDPAGLRYAAVIDIAASRGARPFPVPRDAPEILLILPLEVSTEVENGTLRITSATGDEVYRDTFQQQHARWSRLYLSLPRALLEPGDYRITVAAPDARQETLEFRFAIEDPAPQ